MGKSKSAWYDIDNQGKHRFVNDQRVSVCGKIVRPARASALSKAPSEGCAACGGKQPVVDQQSTESGESDESGHA